MPDRYVSALRHDSYEDFVESPRIVVLEPFDRAIIWWTLVEELLGPGFAKVSPEDLVPRAAGRQPARLDSHDV